MGTVARITQILNNWAFCVPFEKWAGIIFVWKFFMVICFLVYARVFQFWTEEISQFYTLNYFIKKLFALLDKLKVIFTQE